MLSCEICEIFKDIFLYKTSPMATFETKYIHALAAVLLHIRIWNLDWCKCGHCKNEARKIDCLCCREVNAMLITLSKIPERERSISPCRFYGQQPDCWSHDEEMSFSFCTWCIWTNWGGGAESIVLLIFVLWHCFNRHWVRGCRVGTESLI